MKLVKHLANLGYGSRKDVQWMFREGRVTDAFRARRDRQERRSDRLHESRRRHHDGHCETGCRQPSALASPGHDGDVEPTPGPWGER